MADEARSPDKIDIALAELILQRARIDKAIAALQELKSGNIIIDQGIGGEPTFLGQAAFGPGIFLGKSIAEAAKQLLAYRKTPLGNQEIADGLVAGGIVFSGETPTNTVGSVMHRESQREGSEVVRVSRGKWGLTTWFSNPSRFRRVPESDESSST